MVFWKYFYVSVEALTINIHSSPKFDKHLFLRFFYCPVDWKIYLYLMILPFSLCLLLSMYYANQLSLHIVKRWSYVTDVLCGQKHNPTWPHEPGTQQYPTCGFHVLVSCGKTRNAAMECGWAAPACVLKLLFGRNGLASPKGDLQICSEVGNSRGRVLVPDCPLLALQRYEWLNWTVVQGNALGTWMV